MNANEQVNAEIERNERWLKSFSSPTPDAVTIERVKSAMRLAIGADELSLDAARAIETAKSAVRREIHATGSTRTPSKNLVLPLWGPIGVLAAAVAMACTVLWDNAASNPIDDPQLASFVTVMSRPVDPAIATLFELDDAILSLTDIDTYGGVDAWADFDFGFDDDTQMDANGNGAS